MTDERALSYKDLLAEVPYEDNITYLNYWKEPHPTLVSEYVNKYDIKTNCASECINCQISHIEKYKDRYPNSAKESHRIYEETKGKKGLSHAWQINCPLIPKSYDERISPLIAQNFSKEELEIYRQGLDPTEFAFKQFGWRARKHQEIMLKCQSKRKVLRWGRRAGKTEAFVIEILWKAMSEVRFKIDPDTGETETSGYKILIVAPYESQIIKIFEEIQKFITKSPMLAQSVKESRKSPHFHIGFKNGNTIKGFTTGQNEAESLRGQDAHMIVLDEADYMTGGDYKTIIPILQSHRDVVIRVSSTPKGKRERFYQWCVENPKWKEFYFPSAVIDQTPYKYTNLSWDEMRMDMRPEYSHDGWLQEVMAFFISNAQGVYQPVFIADAQAGFTYEQMRAKQMSQLGQNFTELDAEGWNYAIGVDWNSNAGTEICVVGYNPRRGFQVMDSENVPKQEFTQVKGLEAIINMINLWRPKYVYVDAGHGATNAEMLRLWAQRQPEDSWGFKIQDHIKRFDFGSKVEIRDPATKQIVKHPAKAFLVENSVRKFEDRKIKFPATDDKLKKQLMNYIVKSVSESGKPLYGMEVESIGDHALDALNLALIAWQMEEGAMSSFSQVETAFARLASMQELQVKRATNPNPLTRLSLNGEPVEAPRSSFVKEIVNRGGTINGEGPIRRNPQYEYKTVQVSPEGWLYDDQESSPRFASIPIRRLKDPGQGRRSI